MTAGLLNKAQRGELALSLPIGLVRDAIGQVRKDLTSPQTQEVRLPMEQRNWGIGLP